MTTVFLSGSRKISQLNSEIQRRLENMIDGDLKIVVGDANGADKAMQGFLAKSNYLNVTVFYVGSAPRNNVGHWPSQEVPTKGRPSGRDFYAQKDKYMSQIADFGFVLWDGKSSGSVQNMLWLTQEGKKLVVYYSPEHHFYNFKNQPELRELFLKCDEETLADISRKISFPESFKHNSSPQASFEV